MKKLVVLGALLAGVPATSSPVNGPHVIPLNRFQGKQFTLKAKIAGVERTLLFDTGEGVTMISPQIAREVRCQPWGNITGFRMAGERIDVPRCDDVAIELAGRRYVAPTTIVYDLAKVDPDTASLGGAVGLDLFAGRTITIRFATGDVIVETPASAARRVRNATEVPIRLSRPSEGAALDVNIGVDTPRGRAWMELDSGNAGPTIFVSPQTAPLLGLRADTREAQPVTATIAPSVTFTGKARVFPNMIMDGNIGMQLMGRRDLTLDLKAGRAWISTAR